MSNNEYFWEWGSPIPINNHILPTFDTNIFPQWLKAYIEGVTEETQTPVDAAAFGALMMLSTVLGGSFIIKPNATSWTEQAVLFSAVALDPSNRKSAIFNLLMSPINNFENNMNNDTIPALIQKEEKKNNHLLNEKPLRPIRFYTNDVTPEKLAELMKEYGGRYAIISSEGAEFFDMISGRYSNKINLDIYLKGYSGEEINIDRKNGTEIRLQKTALTVGLFVQNSVLKNIPQSFLDRGLWQRFLFSMPESNIGFRKIETLAIPQIVKDNFHENVMRLLYLVTYDKNSIGYKNIEGDKVILEFDEGAKQHLLKIQNEIELRLRNKDLNDAFKGWLGKLVGQIIRISGLIHVAENIESNSFRDLISVETLRKADLLREYLIQHAEAAFGIAHGNTNINDLLYLLNRLRSSKFYGRECFTEQELWQSVKKRFSKSSYLKGLLAILEEMNYIKVVNAKKTLVYVNPKWGK